MTRVVHAANDIWELVEKQGGCDDGDFYQVREKYDIPQGVYIFLDESMDLGAIKDKSIKDMVKHWVSGTLDENECSEAFFYMEAIEEIDWGWVFMERPINYYGIDKLGDYWSEDEAYLEFAKIGTRKSKPHNKAKFKAYPI